jgi:hypothetical protein
MNVIDLRMNKVLSVLSPYNEEVTAVCLSQSLDTLVIGYKDGTIKLLNLNKDFECRETCLAF